MSSTSASLLVQVEGASNIVRALKLLNTETNARCRAAISTTLSEAKDDARGRVPKDTGELDATIRTEMLPDYPTGWLEVGYGTLKRRSRAKTAKGKARAKMRKPTLANMQPGVYAMVVEFGDPARHKPAEPYITPAIEAARPKNLARIESALKSAASAAGGA